jgi:FKBP-type peptidyl-prolyl cis-trans isomerase
LPSAFAEWDNSFMPKTCTLAVNLFAPAIILLATAVAQQPAAPKTQTTPPAKSQTTAKTGQTGAAKTATPLTLKTKKEKFSYALGMNIGNGMHKQGVEIDPSILARGMKDALAGRKSLLSEDEARAVIMQVQSEVRQKEQEKAQQAGAANKKEGEDFLASNKAREGVVTLPSGLQYKILAQGTGPKPAATDSVVCNYRGTLINGKEFDSSYKGGQPITFAVNGVIKGWTEALQLMPVGSKWQLFIPSGLAYGERGAGADIGPDATLIFEVELLSIQNPNEKKENEKKDNDTDKK